MTIFRMRAAARKRRDGEVFGLVRVSSIAWIGEGGEPGGLFVPVLALFAESEFEFAGEGGDRAPPVGYGVAVEVFDGGGLGDGVSGGKHCDDAVLLRGQGGIG